MALPEETLKRARHLAAEKGVSLSRLLSETLEQSVLEDQHYSAARKSALAQMKRGVEMGVGIDVPWTRDDLHQR